MKNAERKYYETPTLNELGDLKEITQAGSAANSDTEQYINDSAWGSGELAS